MQKEHDDSKSNFFFEVCLIACFVLSSCNSNPTRTPEIPPVGVEPPVYGLVYAYPPYAWGDADRPAMRENFKRLKSMGIETVIQVFPTSLVDSEKEANWLIFLDEADRAGINVIASLWASIEQENETIDYPAISRFLSVISDHPALMAYLGLHEPLERFSSEQMREFYSFVKSIAPDLLVAHFMGDIAGFDNNVRYPNREFSSGICDICLIWYYPARYKGDLVVFEKEEYRKHLVDNRELRDKRAPTAQIWYLGQGFSFAEHEHNMRMPTPQEMEDMFIIAYQEQVDGFLWYPWIHDSYDNILSDVEMEDQRKTISQIYQEYILPGPLLTATP